MPRPVLPNAERAFRQDAEIRAAGRFRYSQNVGPRWSDSEEEIVSQAPNHGRDRRISEYREAQSSSPPPPPYSEQDPRLDGGQTLSNSRFKLYPGEEGRAEYVPTSSGGRDRLVTNEHGERVSWPFPDHENSSDDGDGDPDMIYLESGRIFPRSEWEANHPVEYSSEGPSDDTDGEVSQIQRRPMPRAGNWTPRHWSLEDDSDRSDLADQILWDVEDGPVEGLEKDHTAKVPNRGAIRVTISKGLLLVGSAIGRSTELEYLKAELDGRQRVPEIAASTAVLE